MIIFFLNKEPPTKKQNELVSNIKKIIHSYLDIYLSRCHTNKNEKNIANKHIYSLCQNIGFSWMLI